MGEFSQDLIRFGHFELDVRTRELRKGRIRLRIPDQSLEILIALVEKPGDLVTREELRQRLWPSDTFVDFDHGVNAAVRRLRDALGDSAAAPRFVETLPRRGYRFIGSLTRRSSPVTPEQPAIAPELVRTETVAAAPASEPPPGLSGTPRPWSAPSARPEPPSLRLLAIGVFLLLIVAVVGWTAGPVVSRGPAATDVPDPVPALSRITFERGLQTEPSLSPDGRLVAYAANTAGNFDIWVRPVSGGEPRRVTTHPATDWQPDWSPDGTRIVFRSERDGGGLFTVSPGGGNTDQLTRNGHRPRWSPDGSRIVFVQSLADGMALTLFVTSSSGGAISPLGGLTPRERRSAFGWHPDGRRVAVMGSEGPDPFWFLTVAVDGSSVERWKVTADVQRTFGEHHLVVPRNHAFAWDADHDLIYFVAASRGLYNVWRLQADSRSGRIVGGPDRLTTNQEAAVNVAVSRDGRRILFDAASRHSRIWLYALDADGGVAPGGGRAISDANAHAYSPDLSFDGEKVVFLRERPGGRGEHDLVLHTLSSGAERVLLMEDSRRGETRGSALRWSPDDSRIAYRYVPPESEVRPGEITAWGAFQQLRVYDFKSRHEFDVTSPVQAVEGPFGWSLDGRHLLTAGRRHGGAGFAIARTPVTAAPRAELRAEILTTSDVDALWQCSPSPDGRWIVAIASREERSRLVLLPANGGALRDLTDGWSWDDKPRWSADGRTIYFISGRGGIFNVWALPFDPAAGRAVGDPVRVTEFDSPGEQILPHVGLMEMSIRNGRLVTTVIRPSGGLWMLDNVRP